MMTYRLLLILLALLGAGDVLASDENIPTRDVVFELKQFDSQWNIFFHPAGEQLSFTKRGGRVLSNVLVYAEYPRSGGTGEGVVRSRVDAWIDAGGHLHAVSVLKRQLAYHRVLEEWRQEHFDSARCDYRGCWLESARPAPYFVPELQPTGILDRQTLLIPVFKLELRFDALSRWFMRTPLWTGEQLKYWDGKARAARDVIDALRTALLSVPCRRHVRPQIALHRTLGDGLGGLTDIDLPANHFPAGLDSNVHNFSYPASHVFPEETVEESADPASLSDADVALLREREDAALLAVADAEAARWVIFGDEE